MTLIKSKPTTLKKRPKERAKGVPTYPNPITPIEKFFFIIF